MVGHLVSHPIHSEGMLQASVIRPRKDEMRKTGLADSPEPLKRRVANQLERSPFDRNGTVDRIENRFPNEPTLARRHAGSDVPGALKRPGVKLEGPRRFSTADEPI
jgi:hypothetical protein